MGWTLGWPVLVSCEGAMQGGKWLGLGLIWRSRCGDMRAGGYDTFHHHWDALYKWNRFIQLFCWTKGWWSTVLWPVLDQDYFFLQFKRCNWLPRKMSLTCSWSSILAWAWWTWVRVFWPLPLCISDSWPGAPGMDIQITDVLWCHSHLYQRWGKNQQTSLIILLNIKLVCNKYNLWLAWPTANNRAGQQSPMASVGGKKEIGWPWHMARVQGGFGRL